VQLKTGSLSMLSPSAKAAVAEQLFGIRDPENRSVISLEELRSIIVGNVGGLLGLQDDPQRQRIRRQIEQWVLGPPQGWEPPQPILQPGPVDPMTGEPAGPPTQVIPPDPTSMAIFAPRPSDDEPEIARVRAFELGRLLASTRFDRWPDVWKRAPLQEYLRMRQAAGIQTVAEQQAAAQQQQLMAQQPQQPQPGPGQAQPPGAPMAPSGMPPGQEPGSVQLPAAPMSAGPSPELGMVQQQLAGLSAQVNDLAQQVALSHAQPTTPGQPIVVNIQPSPVAQTVRVIPDGTGGYTLEKGPSLDPELVGAGETE
jgi:hypothetical protein